MENSEKLSGAKISTLIGRLKDDRTSVKLRLMGRDYERLTIIVGVRSARGNSFFLIDYPHGFKEAVEDLDTWPIRFEFKGESKIPYYFKTNGGEIAGRDIWIPFPRYIERRQRRRDFRISAPLGTRIELTLGSNEKEMSVINFSQGGAYVSFVKNGGNEPVLKESGVLNQLALFIPFEKVLKKIRIKEATVRRVEKDPITGHLRYGLQFTDMEKDERLFLKNIIYRTQRYLLRKR